MARGIDVNAQWHWCIQYVAVCVRNYQKVMRDTRPSFAFACTVNNG